MTPARLITAYRPYRADMPDPAPHLPMSRTEMDTLGWDACDIILVTGDAYVDLPSFGMAIIGRLLESQGFRVGIIAQPDWHGPEPFRALGRPRLFFGVTAGNMDSMVNRYTSDRKVRNDDAYTPDNQGGKRPDRSVLVYANRCREAYRGVPVIIGGIEASLRRIAHYDYWSNKVRRSVLADSKADLVVFGNAERAIVEIAHRMAAGEPITAIRDVRGTGFMTRGVPPQLHPEIHDDPAGKPDHGEHQRGPSGWQEIDSTRVDTPRPVDPATDAHPDPYAMTLPSSTDSGAPACNTGQEPAQTPPLIQLRATRRDKKPRTPRSRQVIRLPSFDDVTRDPVLYAHASRVLHIESNPHNARALLQRHGDRDVWLNPPPIPLTTPEMDAVFDLPYARTPHPSYGQATIPAYNMIRFSVNILRGCFGGCTFCSITEHEGRIIQNRSEASILREIAAIRDKTPGFTGVISDLGGPTANMYRLACKSPTIEAACRRPSCVFPDICSNLDTDHDPLIRLYRKARALPGVKKILIASGLRYDLAVRSPEYVAELATHHVGGYLKIAPEHTRPGPLSKMMKPGISSYYRFKKLFDQASKRAGKKQYLIPYFIAAHPGTTDEDMLELALWLKKNGFRADQVQAFLPSPMASATAMYHTELDPLRSLKKQEPVTIPKAGKTRRLHKAFLRYHDPENWPLLRQALQRMGRGDLIGNGDGHLVPRWQPSNARGASGRGDRRSTARPGRPGSSRPNRPGRRQGATPALTQHTGLPPSGERQAPGAPRKPRKPRKRS